MAEVMVVMVQSCGGGNVTGVVGVVVVVVAVMAVSTLDSVTQHSDTRPPHITLPFGLYLFSSILR